MVKTFLSAALLACCAVVAQAQNVEQFYSGRQLTLITSFAPGGLNDIAGRLVSRHLRRFIPGQPSIVVQNMPGAGGLVAANYLFNVASADGSIIGQLDRSVAQSGLRGAPNVKFDALKFTWLGSLSTYGSEAYVLWVNKNHPAQTVADLGKPGIRTRLGAVTGGTNSLISLVAQKALGLNVEVI
ncbi:MAG: tripartite tricarboxylate transporter family receptor, partial [Frankiales bacterium]|nr:tripartite tricarboxylate transporter family receptor [Frankiales bacterium]